MVGDRWLAAGGGSSKGDVCAVGQIGRLRVRLDVYRAPHGMLRDAGNHADGQVDIAAQHIPRGVKDEARVGARLVQVQIVQRQDRSRRPGDRSSIEGPDVSESRPGGAHREGGALTLDAHEVRRLGHNGGRNASSGKRCARGLWRGAPVAGVVAVGSGIDPADGSSQPVRKPSRPGCGVLVVHFVQKDIVDRDRRRCLKKARHIHLNQLDAILRIVELALPRTIDRNAGRNAVRSSERGQRLAVGGVETHHQQIAAGREDDSGRKGVIDGVAQAPGVGWVQRIIERYAGTADVLEFNEFILGVVPVGAISHDIRRMVHDLRDDNRADSWPGIH